MERPIFIRISALAGDCIKTFFKNFKTLKSINLEEHPEILKQCVVSDNESIDETATYYNRMMLWMHYYQKISSDKPDLSILWDSVQSSLKLIKTKACEKGIHQVALVHMNVDKLVLNHMSCRRLNSDMVKIGQIFRWGKLIESDRSQPFVNLSLQEINNIYLNIFKMQSNCLNLEVHKIADPLGDNGRLVTLINNTIYKSFLYVTLKDTWKSLERNAVEQVNANRLALLQCISRHGGFDAMYVRKFFNRHFAAEHIKHMMSKISDDSAILHPFLLKVSTMTPYDMSDIFKESYDYDAPSDDYDPLKCLKQVTSDAPKSDVAYYENMRKVLENDGFEKHIEKLKKAYPDAFQESSGKEQSSDFGQLYKLDRYRDSFELEKRDRHRHESAEAHKHREVEDILLDFDEPRELRDDLFGQRTSRANVEDLIKWESFKGGPELVNPCEISLPESSASSYDVNKVEEPRIDSVRATLPSKIDLKEEYTDDEEEEDDDDEELSLPKESYRNRYVKKSDLTGGDGGKKYILSHSPDTKKQDIFVNKDPTVLVKNPFSENAKQKLLDMLNVRSSTYKVVDSPFRVDPTDAKASDDGLMSEKAKEASLEAVAEQFKNDLPVGEQGEDDVDAPLLEEDSDDVFANDVRSNSTVIESLINNIRRVSVGLETTLHNIKGEDTDVKATNGDAVTNTTEEKRDAKESTDQPLKEAEE
ncbi:tegument protein pp100 [Suid betaherpesvirus 2]|uniref:Tegument protein pp100 n=1 Tax=Suid betaherpesvirus 2 TaxID=1608255 RepID=U3GS09_9BETA|nr:tegument protein pp100 [Suid betaherpesvirus 2]AGT99209.1 tegument protein pp100 [Suid betaherpesvirus 2]